MGRAPCCDKANVKKGPWSPEEDAKLKAYIEQHGTGDNWIALPQKIGLKRCGKSCRLRWLNYLRPNIKHGGFSEEEDNIICSLYISIGSRWSVIAAQLPGRTDNDIKNYWNTRLKKKLFGKQRKVQQARRLNNIKQEEKREINTNPPPINLHHDNNIDKQNPYWPDQLPVSAPIPFSNQEPSFNDHASIRRLLVKLGGRFSEDDHVIHNETNLQFASDITTSGSTQQVYDQQSVNVPSSACSLDSLSNNITTTDQFSETAYTMDQTACLQMLQGQSCKFSADQGGEMVYSNSQRFNGLEFLYEEDTFNIHRIGSTCESSSWGETSFSMAYPLVASVDYESIQQSMLQGCAFGDDQYTTEGQ